LETIAHPASSPVQSPRPSLLDDSKLLRTLIDHLPDSIFVKDIEGRFLIANLAHRRALGVAALQELIGKTDCDFYPEAQAAQYTGDEQDVMSTGNPLVNREEPVIDRAGQRRWLLTTKVPLKDAEGHVIGLVGISRDITGRRRAEEALRESEERFRRMFEEAPVAYHEIDSEGITRRVNRAECILLGFEPSDIVGKPIWEFVAPEQREQSREAVRKKLADLQLLAPFRREYVRRDGTHLVLEIHENLIRDTRGQVVGIRSTLLDITERQQAEEEVARQARELARSNSELERFAYVASHDLQEPLRKIRAFGDRLKGRCAEGLGEQGRDYLERIQNAAGRMQTLISALLTFSRLKAQAQPFTRVDLAEVARTVVSNLETSIEQAGARVEIGDLPVIDADPVQMTQLLQNLVGNALKFHRQEEPPLVRLRTQLAVPPSQRPEETSAPLCQILVEDNGIGFDEKYLDRIFLVFQRLHGRGEYEGTGVGLAICREIVERHGGTITAQSAPGRGATFVVTLPATQPKGHAE